MKKKNDKILVLDAMPGRVKWTLFCVDSAGMERKGEIEISRMSSLRDCIQADSSDDVSVRVIAIHTPFGGHYFEQPVVLSAEYERMLSNLTVQAPLHVPSALAVIRGCRQLFPRVRRVLFCETAFYTNLPERESSYALSQSVSDRKKLRRYGYYGLYHEAAARKAAESITALRQKRILSFCVDFRAELAAVVAGRPVMVTGGLTPLEGLPGMTMCGDLDPSIVLTIHEKKRWGSEKINRVLTEASGLFGLTGKRISFEELLLDERWNNSLARRLIKYRLKLAVGAGIAAMGGVDCLTFSGRFAATAEKTIGHGMREKISGMFRKRKVPVVICGLAKSIEQIIADRLLLDYGRFLKH